MPTTSVDNSIRSPVFLGLLLSSCTLVSEVCAQQPGYVMWLTNNGPGPLSGLFYAPTMSASPWQVTQPTQRGVAPSPIVALPGNRHLLVNETDTGSGSTFYLFSRDARNYQSLFRSPPIPPLGSGTPWSCLVDQEGDLVVLPYGADGLYRLRTDMSWERIGVLTPPPPGGRYTRRLIVDLDSGDYIVSHDVGIFRVRPTGETLTISTAPFHATAQDPETGEFLLWNGTALMKMTGQGVITFSGISWPYTTHAPEFMLIDDHPSTLGEYIIVANGTRSLGSQVSRISRWGGPYATGLQSPSSCSGMVFDQNLNVSTARAGVRNKWDVLIDFASDAGYPYVCLASKTGYTPGIGLSDGRRIRLQVDSITALGIAGMLPGSNGLSGVLDSRGTAVGQIDLSGIGPAARGTPFWLVGIVLDPAAPSGIRRISPPVVVQIR